jgi:hypothetical protein
MGCDTLYYFFRPKALALLYTESNGYWRYQFTIVSSKEVNLHYPLSNSQKKTIPKYQKEAYKAKEWKQSKLTPLLLLDQGAKQET